MGATVHVSDQFRLELLKRRAAGVRVYEIARAADVRSNELSGIAAGSKPVRLNDARVLRVAAVLGLPPADCFADSRDAETAHLVDDRTPRHADTRRAPKGRRSAPSSGKR